MLDFNPGFYFSKVSLKIHTSLKQYSADISGTGLSPAEKNQKNKYNKLKSLYRFTFLN